MIGYEAMTVSEKRLRVNVINPYKIVDFLNARSSVKTNTACVQAKPIFGLDHFNGYCGSFPSANTQRRNTLFKVILLKGV